MAKTQSKSPYSVHPGVAMMRKWIADLPEKTGRTLEQWIALVEAEGPPDEKERREWLKEKHGLGTNASWWVAEHSVGKGQEESDPEAYLKAAEAYVEAMYSGAKANLRPIYERLLKLGLGLGRDVKACPCKTIVPLYRARVFAEIKPATRTRIDLGLALGNLKGAGRLIEIQNRPKGNRISHRIAIGALDEIDDKVRRWLKAAYDLEAKAGSRE
jgi:hypothetical protein